MTKLYCYLYYRAFDLIKLTGNYDVAWGASHFLALTMGIVVLRILYFFGEYLNFLSMGIFAVIMFIIVHVANYVLFLKEDRYKEIIESYDRESKQQRKIARLSSIMVIIVLIYTLF